jgi:type IV pilus assembly protein PilB
MKIESYLVASTVSLIIGQHLVRKICPYCKTAKKLSPEQEKILTRFFAQRCMEEKLLYFGKGCETCNFSGFLGRVALHEVLEMNEPIKEAVLRKASSSEINSVAKSQGMAGIMEDGFEKVLSGVTTIEEVLRVDYE